MDSIPRDSWVPVVSTTNVSLNPYQHICCIKIVGDGIYIGVIGSSISTTVSVPSDSLYCVYNVSTSRFRNSGVVLCSNVFAEPLALINAVENDSASSVSFSGNSLNFLKYDVRNYFGISQ